MTRLPFARLRRWWRARREAGPPQIVDFRCETAEALVGGEVIVAWHVVGAGAITLEPNLGDLPSSGRLRVPVHADAPASWTLIADSRRGRVTRSLPHPPIRRAGAALRTLASPAGHSPIALDEQPMRAAAHPARRQRHPADRRPVLQLPQLHPAAQLRAEPRVASPDHSSPELPA